MGLTTLLLLFPANVLTLMYVQFGGIEVRMRLSSGVYQLVSEGWILLPLVVMVTAVLLPFLRFGLLVASLSAVRLEFGKRWRGAAFRWTLWLDRWTMPEVFLIAAVVGYARLRYQAPSIIFVGEGGWCFLAAAFLSMFTRALLDRRTVWRAIGPEYEPQPGERVLSCTVCDLVRPMSEEGHPCPRCGLRLRTRWPGSWERALALTVAGLLFYIPANFYPMNVQHLLGNEQSYRIVDGIIALFQVGLWPIGIMIACTSIAVPAAKLLGLGWCLWSVRTRSRRYLRLKTRLYRLIDESGRWSAVDPYAIAIMVPLIHYRGLVTTEAAGGSTAFVAVVILTMMASRIFDPRLIWDAALEPNGAADIPRGGGFISGFPVRAALARLRDGWRGSREPHRSPA